MKVLRMTLPRAQCRDEGDAVRAIHIEGCNQAAPARESGGIQGMDDAIPANPIARRLDFPACNRADMIRGLPEDEPTGVLYVVPSRGHAEENR